MPVWHSEFILPVSNQVTTDPDNVPVCNGKGKEEEHQLHHSCEFWSSNVHEHRHVPGYLVTVHMRETLVIRDLHAEKQISLLDFLE